MTTTTEKTMADRINRHLECGGVVQVTTHTKSWLYTQKHAGWFSMIDGSLHVQHGRGKNQLSNGDKLLVSIRFGQYEN